MTTEFGSFEQRKKDHVKLALDEENQAAGMSSLERVKLTHDSLPELNLNEISIERTDSTIHTRTPFFVSGMTAGHDQAQEINSVLASVCSARGWFLGVGSQRREFETLLNEGSYSDPSISTLSTRFPDLKIISNLGLAQVIEAHAAGKISVIVELAQKIGASVLGIHLNPLQEAIQPEGTPHYRGAFQALKALSEISPLPLLIKETGCGMSEPTIQKLKLLSPFAIDVSGLGGTHWGRIEGKRAEEHSVSAHLGETFKNWGIATLDSVIFARKHLLSKTELWASGGLRTGLDAAKLLALGSTRVGFAMPALEAALQGEAVLDQWMNKIETELKVAMFCTNSENLNKLALAKVIYE